jgi:hypothetical protein
MARPSFAALAGLGLLAWVAAACGGGGEPTPTVGLATPAPTARPSPSATLTADQQDRLLQEDQAKPFFEGELAGIRLWSAKDWYAQGRSLCASSSFEAPYFGPVVFSVRDDELPALTFPEGYELLDVRMCKDRFTAVGYVLGNPFVVLAEGVHEWPINAPAERLSAGTVAGRPAVFVAPVFPGQYMGAAVIVAEDFGLVVVSRMDSLEEARRIAEGIVGENIQIPKGQDAFNGTLNGIRFYDNFRADNRKDGCLWGSYGIEDPEAGGAEIPPDTPLDIIPAYLPAGYSFTDKHGTTCDGGIDLVESNVGQKSGHYDLYILRLAGEPAWYSVYSEDWLTPGEIAGRPAVFIAPPAWAGAANAVRDYPVQVVVKEHFGVTVVTGKISLEEAKRVAEGLNR